MALSNLRIYKVKKLVVKNLLWNIFTYNVWNTYSKFSIIRPVLLSVLFGQISKVLYEAYCTTKIFFSCHLSVLFLLAVLFEKLCTVLKNVLFWTIWKNVIFFSKHNYITTFDTTLTLETNPSLCGSRLHTCYVNYASVILNYVPKLICTVQLKVECTVHGKIFLANR